MNTEQIRTIENVLNCKLADKDNGVFKFVFKAHKDRYIEFYVHLKGMQFTTLKNVKWV